MGAHESPGGPIRARPIGPRGAHKGQAHKGPGEPIRARPTRVVAHVVGLDGAAVLAGGQLLVPTASQTLVSASEGVFDDMPWQGADSSMNLVHNEVCLLRMALHRSRVPSCI